MAHKESVEAIERSMPKIFNAEDKVKLNSKMIPQIKDWKNDVDYKISLVATQLASRVLEDGTVEAEFEIKKAKAL